MAAIGVQIKQLRKSRGWSAQKLANETGGVVTRSVIADVETGRRRDISLSAGVAIARVFGITVEELVDEATGAALVQAEIAAKVAELEALKKSIESELDRIRSS